MIELGHSWLLVAELRLPDKGYLYACRFEKPGYEMCLEFIESYAGNNDETDWASVLDGVVSIWRSQDRI